MLKVGLTGGIGSGKTTVAKVFAKLNIPVIDADEIAHRLVEKGQPALAQIRQEFGPDILSQDGSLDRKKLGERVFSDSEQKQKLESILHPLIYKTIQSEIERLNAPYCIICIPLLFETGMVHFVDRVLVIDCPVEMQVDRVKKRDSLTIERIQSVINSQVSREFRKEKADDLIDSTVPDYRLAEQVKKLHNSYLSLSDH
ncbi:MAG: dephospho-CoA kinase [Methylobacter sp.]|jgi:dephospho-CoA kinase